MWYYSVVNRTTEGAALRQAFPLEGDSPSFLKYFGNSVTYIKNNLVVEDKMPTLHSSLSPLLLEDPGSDLICSDSPLELRKQLRSELAHDRTQWMKEHDEGVRETMAQWHVYRRENNKDEL